MNFNDPVSKIFTRKNDSTIIDYDMLKKEIENNDSIVLCDAQKVLTTLTPKDRTTFENFLLQVICGFLKDEVYNVKMFSMFSTVDICDELIDKHQITFLEQFQQHCNQFTIDECWTTNLYLSLIVCHRRHRNTEILNGVGRILAENIGVLEKGRQVLLAINSQRHFLLEFLESSKDIDVKIDENYSNMFLLCKIMYIFNKMSTTTYEGVSSFQEYFKTVDLILSKIDAEKLPPHIRSYYYEIGRRNFILQNIYQQLPLHRVGKTIHEQLSAELLKQNSILKLGLQMDSEFLSRDDLRQLINKHHEFIRKIYAKDDNTDMRMYDQLEILELFIKITHLEETSLDFGYRLDQLLDSVKQNFRNIVKLEDMIFLLESMLSLIFYHVHPMKFSRKVLGKLFAAIKLIATQKRHCEVFTKSNETTKDDFSKLLSAVKDAVWRCSIFSDNDAMMKNRHATLINVDGVLIPHCLDERSPSGIKSSDDEDVDKSKSAKNDSTVRTRVRRKRRNQKTDSDKTNNLVTNHMNASSDKDFINISHDENHQFQLKRSNSLLLKMLVAPETLLLHCVNIGERNISQDVIQMYNLEFLTIGNDIAIADSFIKIKEKLCDIFKKYDYHDLPPDSSATNSNSTIHIIKNVAAIGLEATKVTNIIENFIARYRIEQPKEIVKMLERHKQSNPFLSDYIGDQIHSTYICDLMLGLSISYETGLILFNLMHKHYSEGEHSSMKQQSIDCRSTGGTTIVINGQYKFMKNLIENLNLYKTSRKRYYRVGEILCDEVYPIDPVHLKAKLSVETFVRSVVDNDEIPHEEALNHLNALDFDVNYFSRIVAFYENGCRLLKFLAPHLAGLPIHDILKLDFTEIIGELLFNKQACPIEIELITNEMSINLVNVIVQNCVEGIKLDASIDEKDFNKLVTVLENTDGVLNHHELVDGKKFCKLKENGVFDYLYDINPLISLILKHIFQLNTNLTSESFDSKYFTNLIKLESIKQLKDLFDRNLWITGLNYDGIAFSKIAKFLSTTRDHKQCYNVVHSLKEAQMKTDSHKYFRLRDFVTINLIKSDLNGYHLIETITDLKLRTQFTLNTISSIDDSNMVDRLTKSILSHDRIVDLDSDLVDKLKRLRENVITYREISLTMDVKWTSIPGISRETPEIILEHLIDLSRYDLCLAWAKIHPLQDFPTKYTNFLQIFAKALRNTNTVDCKMFELIEWLPENLTIKFYKKMISQTKMNSLNLLVYIVEYLIAHDRNVGADDDYEKYQISLKIFENLSIDEISEMWMLFGRPLLIIEQYLMNSKLETVTKVVTAIRPLLNNKDCDICSKRSELPNRPFFSNRSDDFVRMAIDHCPTTTHECVDTLLRCYAAKSLDFRIIDGSSASQVFSQSNEKLSIDSIHGEFVLPELPPSRENWIRDEEALHCMCCKRSQFTILTRRHHCRRCGRVVCHSCSTNRKAIPEMYDNIKVRICNDCVRQTADDVGKVVDESKVVQSIIKPNQPVSWKLYGHLKHDNIVRDEFSYEYAPSVPLCLSILVPHRQNEKLSHFLLYQCRKFKNLLRPIQPGVGNPEVDYILVTRMLQQLAVAAKVVRGGAQDCVTVIDHADVILSIVQNGCEALLPMESIDSTVLRKLRDQLMIIEKWSLALELSTKCGFSKTGVMAAYGISSLKSGCYETAREKFSYCFTKLGTEETTEQIIQAISRNCPLSVENIKIEKIRRPKKSPPLLSEIVKILEAYCRPIPPNLLPCRKTISKTLSNTSITVANMKKIKNVSGEPVLNILYKLASLKAITKGNYENYHYDRHEENLKFYESLYYLLTYGASSDIIDFLVRQDKIYSALKYVLVQNVEPEIFINKIYLPFLRAGKTIISAMIEFDETLVLWRDYIFQTCRFLEKNLLFNSLYQLQLLLKDPVRASMTCVKFYPMNCRTFTDLKSNLYHLRNAQQHLQTELELSQWEEIRLGGESASTVENQSILMKMDSKTLNNHINTILRQIEVTKFLAACEEDGKDIIAILSDIFQNTAQQLIPTLFETSHEKIKICVATLLCGRNIEEGYGLAYRIIQDFNLSPMKIYTISARYLAANNRIAEVEKFIDCLTSNNDTSFQISNCDEIISLAIQTAVDKYGTKIKTSADNLIKRVADDVVRINCYIVCGQLKSAYLLAVQQNRLNDIRRIKRQAEILNQGYMIKLCEKKLSGERLNK